MAAAAGSRSVDELLAEIARAGPTGGGGAAVALAAATAAALVGLVAGVAARARTTPGLEDIVAEAEAARRRLIALIDLDVEAYGRVIEARRRTDSGRDTAVRETLIEATRVPIEIATAAVRILRHAVTLLGPARPSTRADVGVAGVLAAAALDGAALTARSNLEGLDDRVFVAESRRRLDELVRDATELRARLLAPAATRPA